jgi:hypothetical protein
MSKGMTDGNGKHDPYQPEADRLGAFGSYLCRTLAGY